MKVVFKVNGQEVGEEATLYEDDNRYEAILKTKSLYIKSITSDEIELYYSKLFSDPIVMRLFGAGKPISKEQVITYVEGRKALWDKKDPFSTFSVYTKNADGNKGEFVGSVTLRESDKPGEVELGGLGGQNYWGSHLGTEAAKAVVNLYAHELAKRRFKIHHQPFTTVMATARPDNPGSWGILERQLKMTFEGVEKKEVYGEDQPARRVYRKRVGCSSSL